MAALIAFLWGTALNRYHPFDFSKEAIPTGIVYAIGSIYVIQVLARTRRPLRNYLLLALGSVTLFYLVCWDAVFDNSDGRYSLTIALLIWASITAGAVVLLTYYERTNRSDQNS